MVRHPRRPVAVGVLAAMVLVSSVLSACTGQTSGSALTVSGRVLRAGADRFIARGAVDYVLPFYLAADGSADAALKRTTDQDFADRGAAFVRMRSEGINLVRIPLSSELYDSTAYGGAGASSYLNRIVATVRAAQAAGLRVLLCWWDSLGWSGDLPGLFRSQWPMMRDVLRAVGPDPGVIYEPFNEPNDVDWPTWQTIMTATLREWRQVFKYRGVLVLDTIGYSWNFSAVHATAVQAVDRALLSSAAQVVFANHRYPNGATCFCGETRDSFMSDTGHWVHQFPIIGTEYGVFDAGYPANLTWMSQLLDRLHGLEASGFNGSVVFVWYWVDPNSLTTGPAGPLSRYGQVASKHLWRRT